MQHAPSIDVGNPLDGSDLSHVHGTNLLVFRTIVRYAGRWLNCLRRQLSATLTCQHSGACAASLAAVETTPMRDEDSLKRDGAAGLRWLSGVLVRDPDRWSL